MRERERVFVELGRSVFEYETCGWIWS